MEQKSITEFDQENRVNLCDSCEWEYPDCPTHRNIVFGTGVGGDNICACDEYIPITTRKHTI